jgi:hypothetical protein
LALALGLAGCAMSDEKVGSLLADPMTYEFYSCQQLAGAEGAQKTRQQELEALMAKSASGAGGGVVNTIAYKPEYAHVSGQIAAIHRVQADKNCPPAPAPAAPSPAAKPAPAKGAR